jgi:signal transduction histidine kinase
MLSFRAVTAALSPPRRTLRLRLALLLAALFTLFGAGLLAATYVLVSHATQDTLTYRGSNVLVSIIDAGPAAGIHERNPIVPSRPPGGLDADWLREQAMNQRSDQLQVLLVQSGVALAGMAAFSVVLGWFVAGRFLARLRTITTAAQTISATSLHERLALAGPDDELKELGDTFDGLLARLESSFIAQRQFVANASHELRSPLARQRSISQVALADPDADADSLRAAHLSVLAAGEQQERLIEAMLTLARSQIGFDTTSAFDLRELAERALEVRRGEAAAQDLRLREDLGAAPAAGDPRLVERLIANLVDNTLRHNVPGGAVEVTTGLREGRAVLTVSNTGPEISDDAIERMFQPFQRLAAARTSKADGLGLGLSIVEAIAQVHNAALVARPRPGGGLTVEVTFPPRGRSDNGNSPA